MNHNYRWPICLAVVALATPVLLTAQICWKCSATGGICLQTGQIPSHVACETCGPPPYSCCFEGFCQPTGPHAINASGNVVLSFAANTFSPAQGSSAPRIGHTSLGRHMAPGTSWQVNGRGEVTARNMGKEQATALRRELRQIRV